MRSWSMRVCAVALVAMAWGCTDSEQDRNAADANDAGAPAKTIAVPKGVQTLSDAAFEKSVLKSPVPVVVDFYADWCGPCKILAPTIDQLAKKYEGRVAFGKLNTDHNGRTAQAYGIQGLPTVLVFKDGKIAARLVGVKPANAYQAAIDKSL